MGCCGGRRPARRRSRGRSRVIAAKQNPVVESLSVVCQKRIVMCPPDHYGIDYSINPWMCPADNADKSLAISQWNALHAKLTELGAKVLLVEPKEGLPDMVFTANAGLPLKGSKIFYLSRFKFEERRGEEKWFRQFFQELGYEVHHPVNFFEGAGDALYLGENLICGTGFRSTVEALETMSGWSAFVQLVNPHFYHLDTCFCSLQNGEYLIFPAAFEEESLKMIRARGVKEIIVSEDEALKFACNAVVIGMDVILPSGCPVTCDQLHQRGYQTHPLDMSEFIKAGGACKCLTLDLGV